MKEEKKVDPQPHEDWFVNKAYLEGILKEPKVATWIKEQGRRLRWCGINRNGCDEHGNTLYQIYTHLEVAWDKGDKLYAIPISLHVPLGDFMETIKTLFKEIR